MGMVFLIIISVFLLASHSIAQEGGYYIPANVRPVPSRTFAGVVQSVVVRTVKNETYLRLVIIGPRRKSKSFTVRRRALITDERGAPAGMGDIKRGDIIAIEFTAHNRDRKARAVKILKKHAKKIYI